MGNKSYLPLTQSRKFLTALYYDDAPQLVGEQPKLGFALSFYFFKVYYFVCQEEPVFDFDKGICFAIWQRRSNLGQDLTPKSSRWRRMHALLSPPRAPTAQMRVEDDRFYRLWHRTHRHYYHVWKKMLAENKLSYSEVPSAAFLEAYQAHPTERRIKNFYVKQARGFAQVYGSDAVFYLVKDSAGTLVAGVCALVDEETQQVMYLCAFTTKDPRYKCVGVGLATLCAELALLKGFTYMSFGAIWKKGKDKTWKGFTEFKLRFNPEVAEYNETYITWNYKR